MSPIRMIHPQHGATHVYDHGEVARLEKYGWAVDVPAEKPAPEKPAEPRKPGRPPKAK